MADPTPPTPTPAPGDHTPKPRGYFNQAQLDDLETAEQVLTAAQDHPDDLAKRQITAAYITAARPPTRPVPTPSTPPAPNATS